MIIPKSRLRWCPCVAGAIVATMVLSGCGSSAHTSSTESAGGSSGFPVRLKTAGGVATITHRPWRIVSLSPSATEDLFAVGAGSQVVAVDSLSTSPNGAPRTKLSAYHPNLEAIAKYRPDLVVIADDINHIAEQLAKLHIAVLTYPAPANLNGAYAQLEQLGRATGNTAGAGREIARMRGQIAAIVHSVPRPSRSLTIYHELDQSYYSADSHTFIGQIYGLFGLKNIADKAGKTSNYPQLSAEYIIARDPDLIVLADTICCGQTPTKVAARPGWSHIAAVKDGTVVAVSDTVASEWGPQIVQFVKTIARAVRRAEAREHT